MTIKEDKHKCPQCGGPTSHWNMLCEKCSEAYWESQTRQDKHRLARLILNAWVLGEDLDDTIEMVSGEDEVEENKRVVEENKERANEVLERLEDLVAFAL